MSVRFIPSTQRFVQVAEAEWNLSGWDTDQATILWRGPRTDLKRFLDDINGKRFQPMPNFSRMWLNDVQERNITPSFPGAELMYVGFRNGQIPPVKVENDTSSQVASGQGVDNAPSSPTFGKQISGQITYNASQTTYTWFENSQPNINPRYNTVDQKQAPVITGVSINPVIGDDGLPIPVTTSAFTAVINSLGLELVVADYDRVPLVPGILWGCRSIVQWRIKSA